MTYDFHGPWNSEANHPAPLHTENDKNIEFVIQYWLSKGASPGKICMGIPLYGRSWILSSNQTQPPAPASRPGTPGFYTDQKGLIAYYEICSLLKFPEWTIVKNDRSGVYTYSSLSHDWIGYDDINSVVLKTTYSMNKGLGGIMVWDISMDDFRGNCKQLENPITSAIAKTLKSNQMDSVE